MTNPRDTDLYRKLVAAGMPDATAVDTVRSLDRMIGSHPDGPDSTAFNDAIRARVAKQRNRHTIELPKAGIIGAGRKEGA